MPKTRERTERAASSSPGDRPSSTSRTTSNLLTSSQDKESRDTHSLRVGVKRKDVGSASGTYEDRERKEGARKTELTFLKVRLDLPAYRVQSPQGLLISYSVGREWRKGLVPLDLEDEWGCTLAGHLERKGGRRRAELGRL